MSENNDYRSLYSDLNKELSNNTSLNYSKIKEIGNKLFEWYTSKKIIEEEKNLSNVKILERADSIVDLYENFYYLFSFDAISIAYHRALEVLAILNPLVEEDTIISLEKNLAMIDNALAYKTSDKLILKKIKILNRLNRKDAAYLMIHDFLNRNPRNEELKEISQSKEFKKWSINLYERNFYKGKKYKIWHRTALIGTDLGGNPGFLILFSKYIYTKINLINPIIIRKQETSEKIIYQKNIDDFIANKEKKKKSEEQKSITSYLTKKIEPGDYFVQSDCLECEFFFIQRGNNGHFPSFKNLEIQTIKKYDSDQRDEVIDSYKVYEKHRILKGRYSRHAFIEKKAIENYKLNNIKIPYNPNTSFKKVIEAIYNQEVEFDNFQLYENPIEILQLDESLATYSKKIIKIITNQNIYIRKKLLTELVEESPPIEVYNKILEIGSSELISGLFLELAKQKISLLKEKVLFIYNSRIDWVDERFASGIKRCAKLYLTAIDVDERRKRIKEIEDSLNIKQFFRPDSYYDKFYHIDFKNTLQEAEIFQLPHVIGKLAYFLDARKLTSILKKTRFHGALKYFRRYVRRLINRFSRINDKYYVEALRSFLISYSPDDYVSRFRNNFMENELLRYYIYHDFKEQKIEYPNHPPNISWREWRNIRNEWKRFRKKDQLLEIDGRVELNKEIWDDNLKIVLKIAKEAKIQHVANFCYFVLRDSPNSKDFLIGISLQFLVPLTHIKFPRLREFFINVIIGRLLDSKKFSSKDLVVLIKGKTLGLKVNIREYFERLNGVLKAKDLLDLMKIEEINFWLDIIRSTFSRMNFEQFKKLIELIIIRSTKSDQKEDEPKEQVTEVFYNNSKIIKNFPEKERKDLLIMIIDFLVESKKLQYWISHFLTEITLSVSVEDLKSLLFDHKIDYSAYDASNQHYNLIELLKSLEFDSIPNFSSVISILKEGTGKMVKILIDLIKNNLDQIQKDESLLLVLFESNISVLNNLAIQVYEDFTELKQKQLLPTLIDSPKEHTCKFGLDALSKLYGNNIPKKLLMRMLEHHSIIIKNYISNLIEDIVNNLHSKDNQKLFIYYLKSVLYLPRLLPNTKLKIYNALPNYVLLNKDKMQEIQKILLEIGGSNIKVESSRALVALAKLRTEVNNICF